MRLFKLKLSKYVKVAYIKICYIFWYFVCFLVINGSSKALERVFLSLLDGIIVFLYYFIIFSLYSFLKWYILTDTEKQHEQILSFWKLN